MLINLVVGARIGHKTQLEIQIPFLELAGNLGEARIYENQAGIAKKKKEKKKKKKSNWEQEVGY